MTLPTLGFYLVKKVRAIWWVTVGMKGEGVCDRAWPQTGAQS